MALKVLSANSVADLDVYVQFDQPVRLLGDSNPADALTLGNYIIDRDTALATPVSISEVRKVPGRTDLVALVVQPRPAQFERYKITVSNVQSATAQALDPASRSIYFRGFSELQAPPLDEGSPFVADIANDPVTGDWKVDADGDYANHAGKDFVRKKIARRFTTSPGGFAFIDRFGLPMPLKAPLTQSNVDKVQSLGKVQVLEERQITDADVSLSKDAEGAIRANIKGVMRPGPGDDIRIGPQDFTVTVKTVT